MKHSATMTQQQMCRAADQAYLDRCKHFAEVQAGPNPLTNADLERLTERRPALWSMFRGKGAQA